jgi:hypothetical protein
VALNRLKNFEDFLIEPFSFDRLTKIAQSSSMLPRKVEEQRIKMLCEHTEVEFA